MPRHSDWLNLTIEDTLEPSLPICDPHHHLWTNQTQRLYSKYLLKEYMEDANSGHNIVSSVFIECGEMYKSEAHDELKVVGETEFVAEISSKNLQGQFGTCRVAAGIIGMANLCLGDGVHKVLEEHIKAGNQQFRGIRHGVSWDADAAVPLIRTNPGPELLLDQKFRKGFSHLKGLNLSFECWCYHPQIRELVDLAHTFPDTTIILNHFGIPLGVGIYRGRSEEVFYHWRSNIEKLAKCDNVKIKLGGLNMPENGFDWHTKSLPPSSRQLIKATRRYFETAIEFFGVKRCMFESNFPVDKISCSYNVLWNAFKSLTKDYSKDERASLFHDTAVTTYRL